MIILDPRANAGAGDDDAGWPRQRRAAGPYAVALTEGVCPDLQRGYLPCQRELPSDRVNATDREGADRRLTIPASGVLAKDASPRRLTIPRWEWKDRTMKHVKKLTCLAGLALCATATAAHADPDDNYPWSDPGAFTNSVSLVSRAYSGTSGPDGLAISSATDVDYHVVTCGTMVHPITGLASPGIISSIRIDFAHAQGDLDITVYSMEGAVLGTSNGMGNYEVVGLGTAANRSIAVLKVYGYRGAVNNNYGISLYCL